MSHKLTFSPTTVGKALIFNSLVHRRLPTLQGAMWAVSVRENSHVVGVAIVGRPTARRLDNDCEILQVVRCTVIPGTPNGCSMLYGACARAARNLGARDLLTYIHEDEDGGSLKASGWLLDEEFESRGGQWDQPSRPRNPTVEPGKKKRYWVPCGEWAKARHGRVNASL